MTIDTDDLTSWLRLTLTPCVGNETARQLLAAFGSAQAIFEQSTADLKALGSSDKLVAALQTEPPTLAELLLATQTWLGAGTDRCVLTLGDEHYPSALLDIEDPPVMLYVLGRLDLLPGFSASACLAIVGSRNPTPQGEVNARQFARVLGASGLCVVSGMALGVDGAAHDGALLGSGTTVAVVGTGLDRVYPKKHLALAHRIAENGLILSEFPLGTPPLTANFPKRNRIISGLSQGTLVIEAAVKSGSLITARMAAEQGKDVFAIPGSIHSPQSRGCHFLIKQGAKLVESAQDVMEELKFSPASPGSGLPGASPPDPANESGDTEPVAPAQDAASPLLTALGFDAVSFDQLQARTGIATAQLQAQLLELELDGQVSRLPGGLFQRLARA